MDERAYRSRGYWLALGVAAVATSIMGCSADGAPARPETDGGADAAPSGEDAAVTGQGGQAPTSYDWPYLEPEEPPPPFSEPFTEVVSQKVPWAQLEVEVTGARVERGMRDDIEADVVYAQLDLALTNLGSDEVDYRDRGTWDLLLADGERIRAGSYLEVIVAPMSTAKTEMLYRFSEDKTLEGASLVLEGSSRGTFEPEHIPLDAEWQREYPLRLASLVGVVQPPEEAQKWVKHEIVEATLSRNDPDMGRAHAGEVFLRLETFATAGGTSAPHMTNDNYRVIIDGRAYPPESWVNRHLEPGDSMPIDVVFAIPEETRQFEVSFWASSQGYHGTLSADLDKDAVLVEE